MNCRDAEKYLLPYVDGEFDDSESAEIYEHFKFCPICRKKVAAQLLLKSELQKALPEIQAPATLKSSVIRSIRNERIRQTPATIKYAPALVILLAFLGVYFMPRVQVSPPIVEATVDKHIKNLPFDVSGEDEEEVSRFFTDKLQYAMHVPRFQRGDVHLLGGRLIEVQSRPAAFLGFQHNGRRYSMMARPASEQLPSTPASHRRRINNREYIITSHNGFNVVLWRDKQVVYSFVSDSNANELVDLASATQSPF